MANQTNDDFDDQLESERERLRGVAQDEEEFEEVESDDEDLDDEEESTF